MLLIFSPCSFVSLKKYRGAKLISLLNQKLGRYRLSYKFNDDKSLYYKKYDKINYYFFNYITINYLFIC